MQLFSKNLDLTFVVFSLTSLTRFHSLIKVSRTRLTSLLLVIIPHLRTTQFQGMQQCQVLALVVNKLSTEEQGNSQCELMDFQSMQPDLMQTSLYLVDHSKSRLTNKQTLCLKVLLNFRSEYLVERTKELTCK